MKTLSLWEACRYTSPNPLCLICTKKEDGKTNLATVAWWTPLASKPELIGFSINKPSYTCERVLAAKKLILAIPGLPLAKAAMGCGNCSGRDVDKVEKFNIEMQEMPDSDISVPVHSVLVLPCEVRCQTDIESSWYFICDVKKVMHNEAETPLFCWGDYTRIAPARD